MKKEILIYIVVALVLAVMLFLTLRAVLTTNALVPQGANLPSRTDTHPALLFRPGGQGLIFLDEIVPEFKPHLLAERRGTTGVFFSS